MVRGLVAHGLGYSLLATKPASSMSYDGRSLTTRPLADRTEPSHLALVKRANGHLSETAQAFVTQCRIMFQKGLGFAHPDFL